MLSPGCQLEWPALGVPRAGPRSAGPARTESDLRPRRGSTSPAGGHHLGTPSKCKFSGPTRAGGPGLRVTRLLWGFVSVAERPTTQTLRCGEAWARTGCAAEGARAPGGKVRNEAGPRFPAPSPHSPSGRPRQAQISPPGRQAAGPQNPRLGRSSQAPGARVRLCRCEALREQLCSSRERILGCQLGEGRGVPADGCGVHLWGPDRGDVCTVM